MEVTKNESGRTKLRTVIIENDVDCRVMLESMLAEFDDIEVVGNSTTVKEAKNLVEAERPELLFLDVELDDGTGFNLLETLSPVLHFDVIFTTAHQSYALEAIKMSALDYLLKPVDAEELETAVLKALSKPERGGHISKLMANLNAGNLQDKCVGLPEAEGIRFVKLSEIIACKGEGSYTTFCIDNEPELTVSTNLKKFDELLSKSGFFRIHQSYLINMNHIKKVTNKDGGFVELTNGNEIPIARRRKDLFMQALKNQTVT